MADTVNTIWIYPPLAMNASYATTDFSEHQRRIIVKLTNESDGTGESGVIKINRSDLRGPNGVEPGSLAIEEINWSVHGFNYVTLDFDQTTDQTIGILRGDGYVTYPGGLVDQGSGGTGDIILSTDGGVDGSMYDITLNIRLKQ